MTTDDISRPPSLKEIIRHFTPIWFTAIMGTGSVSLLLQVFPYGKGSLLLVILTLIAYILNLTLFCVFCVITATRHLMFPDIWGLLIRHPSESLFTGTLPMGATTLLNVSVALISDKYRLGGKGFLYTMWGLWWIDVALSVLCAWGMVHIMFASQKHTLESMTAVWLLPVVTLVVGSSTGGVFSSVLNGYNPSYALITQVVSIFMVSIGLTLALMLLTIYILRLIVVGLPQGNNVLSVFLPLGPTGQAGYSILLAGQYFKEVLPLQHGSSTFLTDPSTGPTIYVLCVCISFALWALASMWMIFALLAMQHALRKTRIVFKVNFFGLIFPNGVYANLTISLANTFDSTFFRVWGSIYAAATIIMWIFVAVKTVSMVYNRSIFEAPCLQDLDLGQGTDERKGLPLPQNSSYEDVV